MFARARVPKIPIQTMNNPPGPFARTAHGLAFFDNQKRLQPENSMDDLIHNRTRDETGASMVEYALLLILIAVVAFVGVQVAGQEVSNAFSTVAGGFSTN